MPVPYVPTAVFNTPLPPAARRGGRTSRGSREGGPRGGSHVPSGDRSPNFTPSMGGSKQFSTAERDQSNERTEGSTSNADTTGSEKPSRAQQTEDETKGQKSSYDAEGIRSTDNNYHAHPPTFRPSPSSRQGSKPSKANDALNRAAHKNGDQSTSKSSGVPSDSHVTQRFATNHDRRFESGPRSADVHKEATTFSGERAYPRDYTRDFHKDRGESRTERGRGGYRGRGNHSNYSVNQTTHYHTAPISQQPFPTSKPFGLNDRHRLPSQNGSQQQRANIRSPGMPSPGMYGQPPYPIQTDMNMVYGYPQAHQAAMSAVPFQPYLEQFSLVNMLSMQL